MAASRPRRTSCTTTSESEGAMEGRMSFKALTAAAALAAMAGLIATPVLAQGKPVRIGVLSDMSSLYADLGGAGSVLAAQMAVQDFGGKVNGVPIQVISADHFNKPDTGKATALRWVDDEGVDAVVDVPTSSVALTVQDVMREKGKVFLISGAASSDLTGNACSPTGVHL